MTIFFIATALLFVFIAWQLIVYFSLAQGRGLRKPVLARVIFLVLVLGLCTYAWRAALLKEVQFVSMLPPYPDATLNLLETPVFSDDPYWTYTTPAHSDQVFNWYRSRSKHAGWVVAEEGTSTDTHVFVIKLNKTTTIFVILKEGKKGTSITYTTEGQLMRKSITN